MFLSTLEEKRISTDSTYKQRAREKALKLGFPQRKDEDFRYVSLKRLEETPYSFKDDAYSLSISSDKVEVCTLQEAVDKYGLSVLNRLEKTSRANESFFSLVNKGWGADSFCIFVNESIEEVVEIREKITGDGQVVCPNLQFFVKPGACVSFHHHIEIAGEKNCITRFAEVIAEKESNISFYETVQAPSDNAIFFHFNGYVKERASLYYKSGTKGCRVFRNELKAFLLQKHALADLEGFWNVAGDDEAHYHVHCSHLAEETNSRQHFVGVTDESGKSSFEGQIYVDKIAQKTDSYQLSKHLLVGDKARGYSKPNLEVFADDVKASHGATVSSFDQEELFYLASRGIKKDRAISLLRKGFLSFFLEGIEDKKVSTSFKGLIE